MAADLHRELDRLALEAKAAQSTPEFDAAFAQLWHYANPVARTMAAKFLNNPRGDAGQDLVDEATLRMWAKLKRGGIDAFDPAKGAFSTFVTWKVRGAVGNVIADARRQMRTAPGGLVSLDSLGDGYDIEADEGDPERQYAAVQELMRAADFLSADELDALLLEAGAIE